MGKFRQRSILGSSEPGSDEVVRNEESVRVVKNETLQPVSVTYNQDGEQRVFYLHPNEAREAPEAVLTSSHFKDLERARIVKRIS